MLLRVSRLAFWLAAAAAALALAVPTGWETILTGFAVAASAAAFGFWRAGLAELRRTGGADALLPDAAPLTSSALVEAAGRIEICCAEAPNFEAALHGAARILKAELGALRAVVYRVMGADATHARLSELFEAQPGFNLAEQSVPLQRSALGRAIASRREIVEPAGVATLPVHGQDSVVAVIELSGLQIGIDRDALTALLIQAQAQLTLRAEPTAKAHRQAPDRGYSARLGENAYSETFRTNGLAFETKGAASLWHAPWWLRESGCDDFVFSFLRGDRGFMMSDEPLAVHAPPSGLDSEALARLTELDPKGENKLLERVLRAFQSSVARLMPQLEAARLSGDRATVRLVAHTLKSSSASIGALSLSQVCAQIEASIRADSTDDLGPLLQTMRSTLDAALSAVQRLLDSAR